jgi:hypothetical protein
LGDLIIWPWGQRSRSNESHYGMRHTALWSCTHIPNKYYLKNNYLILMSKVKDPRRSLRYETHRLMVMHPHTKYHWPISKDKNVVARTRKYYLKNNYLTLRSKVKVPRRSLRYATHRIMVMHPHTKYNWPIIDLSGKTKKLWSGQASLRRSRRSGRKNQTKTICLPFIRRGDIIKKKLCKGSAFTILKIQPVFHIMLKIQLFTITCVQYFLFLLVFESEENPGKSVYYLYSYQVVA